MSIKQKMILGAILITLIPITIISVTLGYLSFTSARGALEVEAQNKLVSIRDARKTQIDLYTESLGRVLQITAASQVTVDAMAGFKQTFNNYDHSKLDIDQVRSSVNNYYVNEFGTEYQGRNKGETPVVDDKLRLLSDTTFALQYHYISNNSFPLGSKDGLVAANDESPYSQLHGQYHEQFKNILSTYGMYDIFLVDNETGYIVYSVFKEVDYATSLVDGPFANTGISRAFVKANSSGEKGAILFDDYKPYFPSYNDQAVFLSTPIFDGSRRIGTLIMQAPIDQVNNIMISNGEWERTGLGTSGETYLVGPDGLLRNESRFFLDDRQNYLAAIRAAGLDSSDIEVHNSSIGRQSVSTPASQAALAGESGFTMIPDYRNVPVLSAYTPIEVFGTTWALMAEIDETEAFLPAINLRNNTILFAITLSALVAGLVIFFAFRMVRAITNPISVLDSTVRAVQEGDFEARTGLESSDELGTLGKSFDQLLDDRIAAGQKAEAENEQLNNSIVNLIRAVSQISQRDFTINIPVSEDVTGAVSDALNLLTKEMSGTLASMRGISEQVSEVSTNVSSQADSVLVLAERGQLSVDDTAETLNSAADEMRKIAKDAQNASDFAGSAIEVTEQAFDIVNRSVVGINAIRDTISETEKRIKRLGERSQEITGIVNIINSIAERTHILALNASMHAASAGEAGRGFAVVADEVQRLAENAREATAEITTLVNNIRVETSDTVAVMNTAITQVAEGTRLAEQAGESMQTAQKTTADLVNSVMTISGNAVGQADVAVLLQEKAREIQDSTRKTSEELNKQKKHTDNLVEFSARLVDQVGIFKLPESA